MPVYLDIVKIKDDLIRGLSHRQIAEKYSTYQQQISRFCNKYGLLSKFELESFGRIDRVCDVSRLYSIGLSQQEIADKVGLSRSHVSTICAKNGFEKKWDLSKHKGMPGELLFAMQFNFVKNFNEEDRHSHLDFLTEELGTVDVKFSRQGSQRIRGDDTNRQHYFNWNVKDFKGREREVKPDTYVFYGVGDVTQICLIIPEEEVGSTLGIRVTLNSDGSLRNTSSWLKFLDKERSLSISNYIDLIYKLTGG